MMWALWVQIVPSRLLVMASSGRPPLTQTAQDITYENGTAEHDPRVLIDLFDEIRSVLHPLDGFIHRIFDGFHNIVDCGFSIFDSSLHSFYIVHYIIYSWFNIIYDVIYR
jgi:hypothetical protein